MKRLIIILLIATGCSVEPVEQNISGRYQATDMILLLDQTGSSVTATLEWQGYTTQLNGVWDKVNQQVICGGVLSNCNLSLNLFYKNNVLAGGMNFNGNFFAVRFDWSNPLKKIHNQGLGE